VLHGSSNPARKAPTTAFWVGTDSAIVERRMRERGVIPSARGSVLRLSPHFYSTLDDVDEALDTLASVLHDSRHRLDRVDRE
jgi:selenocysteine lyase/cysteine desulfurase